MPEEETINLTFDTAGARRDLQELQQQIQQASSNAAQGTINSMRTALTGVFGGQAVAAATRGAAPGGPGLARRMGGAALGGFIAGAAQPMQGLGMAGIGGVMGGVSQIPFAGPALAAGINRTGVGQISAVMAATQGRTGSVAGMLARSGVDVPFQDLQETANIVAAQEMRAYSAQRQSMIAAQGAVLTPGNIKEAFATGAQSFAQELRVLIEGMGIMTPKSG